MELMQKYVRGRGRRDRESGSLASRLRRRRFPVIDDLRRFGERLDEGESRLYFYDDKLTDSSTACFSVTDGRTGSNGWWTGLESHPTDSTSQQYERTFRLLDSQNVPARTLPFTLFEVFSMVSKYGCAPKGDAPILLPPSPNRRYPPVFDEGAIRLPA